MFIFFLHLLKMYILLKYVKKICEKRLTEISKLFLIFDMISAGLSLPFPRAFPSWLP